MLRWTICQKERALPPPRYVPEKRDSFGASSEGQALLSLHPFAPSGGPHRDLLGSYSCRHRGFAHAFLSACCYEELQSSKLIFGETYYCSWLGWLFWLIYLAGD